MNQAIINHFASRIHTYTQHPGYNIITYESILQHHFSIFLHMLVYLIDFCTLLPHFCTLSHVGELSITLSSKDIYSFIFIYIILIFKFFITKSDLPEIILVLAYTSLIFNQVILIRHNTDWLYNRKLTQHDTTIFTTSTRTILLTALTSLEY